MTTPVAVLDRRRRVAEVVVATLLALAVTGVALLSLCAGDDWLTPGEVYAAFVSPLANADTFRVEEVRAPRAFGAVVAGFGLGVAGVVTQSVLRNPLASPDIIGVTAGAAAAAVAILAGSSGLAFAAGASLAGAAVVGGLLAGAAVIGLAWSRDPARGGLRPGRVVLVGLGVNAGLGAFSYWLLLRADVPDLTSALIWLAGSLGQSYYAVSVPAAVVVAAVAVVLVGGQRWLGLLRFDDVTVRSLGVAPAPAQLLQIALAVVAASAATAVAGPVGFVAFVAPQIAWRLTRTGGASPLTAGLVGSLIVLGGDLLGREVSPVNMPVGLVTAALGGPFLLWLLVRGGAQGGRR